MKNKKRQLGRMKTYDPRTKLHIFLMIIVMLLVSWKLPSILVCILTTALIGYISREYISIIIKECIGLFSVNILLGVIFILILPTRIGIYTAIKLLLLCFVYLLIMRGIKQGELLDGLIQGFGLRAKTAKALMLILDFIPKVYHEKKRVRRAQRARGVDPYAGNILERHRKDLLLAIPNIKYAFVRTKRQSEAMNKRQYRSSFQRNSIYELKLIWVDKLAAIGFMLLMLASIMLMLFL